MTCANCGAPTVECVDADEPTGSGSFSERYECGVCGAKGYINGRENEDPSNWNKYGSAFEGSA